MGAKNSTGSRVRCEKKKRVEGGCTDKGKKKSHVPSGGWEETEERRHGANAPVPPTYCRPTVAERNASPRPTARSQQQNGRQRKHAHALSCKPRRRSGTTDGATPARQEHGRAAGRVHLVVRERVCGARGVARGASATLVCAAGTAARGRIKSTMKLINCATQQEVRLN